MKAVNVGNSSIKIPMDFISCDHDFNARKGIENDDGEVVYNVEGLAQAIKADGQLSPVLVREIAPEDRESGGPSYELVFGFRRMAAMRSLGQESIMAQVWSGSNDEVDMLFINLAENVSRANLTSYDKAARFSSIKQEHGLSGAKIAARLGQSKGHVNNLIKIYEHGHPEIVKLWAEGHGKAGTDQLVRYVIKEGRSHEDQMEAWMKHCGMQEEEEGEVEEEEVSDRESSEKKIRRVPVKHLENGLAALKDCEEYSDEWIAGATSALRWSLGKTKTFPKVYDPRKKVKEVEEE